MMKKLFLFAVLFPLCFFAAGASAQEVIEAGTFEDFNAAISSSVAQLTIEVSSDIALSGALAAQEANDLKINGRGFTIDASSRPLFTVSSDTQKFSLSDITIKNAFKFSDSDAFVFGGAVFSRGGSNVSNASFLNNGVKVASNLQDIYSGGGAIYLTSTTQISGAVFDADFAVSSNTANFKAFALGGAVFIASDTAKDISVSVSSFTGNYVSAYSFANDATASGGAIYNGELNVLNISSSSFDANYALSSGEGSGFQYNALGGAVYNEGTLNINDANFNNNYALASGADSDIIARGGAIYNGALGVVNAADISFFHNYVKAESSVLSSYEYASGGAVYNEGTFNLNAVSNDIEFTGNKANGVSNAIHNKGTVNLNAVYGKKIVFNDAVDGAGGVINIGSSGYHGDIVFNNSVTGNDINLAYGIIRLSDYAGLTGDNAVAASRGSIGTSSLRNDFTMNDAALLDMANGRADDIVYVNNFTVNGRAKINADIDLAGLSSDKIDIGGSALGSGTLDLSGLSILTDLASVGAYADIQLFSGVGSVSYIGTIDSAFYRYSLNAGSASYRITESADSLGLHFVLTKYDADPFQAALKDYGSRILKVETNYVIGGNYDPVVSSGSLILNGGSSGVSVNAGQSGRIFVIEDSATFVTAQNITFENGFDGQKGGAFYNSGEVSLLYANFLGNSASITSAAASSVAAGAIYNEGVLNVEKSYFSNNLARSESAADNSGAFAYGGAVYLTSSSVTKIKDSVFENNLAQSVITTDRLWSDSRAYGGAIYVDSDSAKTVDIINSVFKGNRTSAEGTIENSRSAGGAIYNGAGNIINVVDSSFISNAAVTDAISLDRNGYGGAIYNAGILNLTASGKDVEFTGNKANINSNAVHNSTDTAIINMNASSSGGKIIFNDAITGDKGVINVNKTGDGISLPVSVGVDGTVEFNNSVTGNNIFLYSGTLKLGSFAGSDLAEASVGSIGNHSSRNDFFISSGAVFDMANDRADIAFFNNVTVDTGTSVLKIDIDLQNMTWDKIDIGGVVDGDGKLDLRGLTIVNEFTVGVSTNIQVLISTYTPDNDYLSDTDFSLYRYHTGVSSSVYRIKHSGEYGTLNVVLYEYTEDAFQNAISSTNARTLKLESDYYVPYSFSPILGAGKLTVNGSTPSVTVNANSITNVFSVLQNSSLELNKVTLINGSAAKGGAIYNSGKSVISQVTFSSNSVSADSNTAVGGGAIYNDNGGELTVFDSVFVNNLADGTNVYGGAIYNDGGVVNLVAENADVEFSANLSNGVSNALHAKDASVYNLNAGAHKIIFNDGITSQGNGNVININASSPSLSASAGIIEINADMSGFGNINSASGNTVNFYAGTVKLGENANFFSNVGFNMYSGAVLDMSNGKMDNISLDGFSFPDASSPAYIVIDADLRDRKTDSLLGSKLALGSAGKLLLKDIVIISEPSKLSDIIVVPFSDDEALSGVIGLEKEKVIGPIFIYNVTYGGGALTFEYAHDYNPTVFIAPVTMLTGGYLGQINSYAQAFETVDDRIEKEGKNGLWVRPYGFSEDIKLSKKLTVSNEGYGAYFGYDSQITDIYSYTMNFSAYGAYNSLMQTYEGAEINQGGGMIGATAVLYGEKFFTALTANMGIISEHGRGQTGKDNFMMYTKGLASKTGCNILFSDDMFQLQPSIEFSYSAIDMASYTNSAGVRVTSDKFAPFHVEPAIKLISNAFENCQIYVNVNFVCGLLSGTNFSANDIDLPSMKIDPYFQYAVGGYKEVSGTFSAGGEIFGRSGGRSGFGGQLTVKMKI
ncbi:MAG: hypothetical protein LBQ47_05575 [Endomicrobium sp.]|jgi:hypothetical protein|nr:hypothetical protein [Endomicrobium sp.]